MKKDKILKKTNESLYIEPFKGKDGKDFEIKWEKKLELIWLNLKEIKLNHIFSVDHPVFSIKTGDKLLTEKYERREQRYITATGELKDRDSIGIIQKDGSTEDRLFREVKVYLRRLEGDLTKDDIERKAVNGFMGHSDFPNEDQHVYLDFGIPSEIFDNAYRELQEVKDKKVTLGVYVDVFNSESDRGLRDYWMPKDFFIEEENLHNHLYFYSLNISELVSNSSEEEDSSEEDSKNPSETSTPILTTIGKNIAEVRFLLILILLLIALRIFKFL